jgi:hypothetical protein
MSVPCAEHLRSKVERIRRHRFVDCDGRAVLGERAPECGRSGGAVVGIVVQQRNVELLWEQVLGEPERDPVVGRRDAKHVRPRRRVDDLAAALEHDADRDAPASGDAPGGIDTCSLVDDRDGVVVDGAAHVRHRLGGRETAVGGADRQGVAPPADRDARGVDLTCREPRSVLDRPPEVGGARERSVHHDEERRRVYARRAAAAACQAACQDEDGADQQGGPHNSHL